MPADRTQLVEAWREVDLQHLAPGGRKGETEIERGKLKRERERVRDQRGVKL